MSDTNLMNKKGSGATPGKDGKDKIQNIDYKMISFKLAGKDYGINILKVKEIRRAGHFTFVPNTPAFVRGVDNLRGDIIPIIDLRIMFNLPAPKLGENELEDIIILRLGDLIIGVVVDQIEKVVGINSNSIQPPHPIFGDINIKYISGVVENEKKLYIILDVDRIFDQGEEEQEATTATQEVEQEKPHLSEEVELSKEDTEMDLNFILDTLSTFGGFHVSRVNEKWVVDQYRNWKKERESKGMSVQLESPQDAQAFLAPFYSRFNGSFWSPEYTSAFWKSIPVEDDGNLQLWNPGCGAGMETYSLYLGFKKENPTRGMKIWANDNDLLGISNAPNTVLPNLQGLEAWEDFFVEAKGGYSPKTEIKNQILFEFHDVTNINPFYGMHVIVCRDLLSHLTEAQQSKLLDDFHEKLKKNGALVIGDNESLPLDSSWELVETEGFRFYKKK